MIPGRMILWRFKGAGKPYRFGYVIRRTNGMAEIGPWNGARAGVWVKVAEVEWEDYR